MTVKAIHLRASFRLLNNLCCCCYHAARYSNMRRRADDSSSGRPRGLLDDGSDGKRKPMRPCTVVVMSILAGVMLLVGFVAINPPKAPATKDVEIAAEAVHAKIEVPISTHSIFFPLSFLTSCD